MNWLRWWPGVFASLVVCGLAWRPALSQEPASTRGGGPRKLAAGVLHTVDPERQWAEAFSRHDVVELLAFDPQFDWAKDRTFRHDVFTLEFKFKPVRMIRVDVPQPSGLMREKLIWYMVYSVTNREIEERVWHLKYNEQQETFEEEVSGDQAEQEASEPPKFGWMTPLQSQTGTYQVGFVNRPIRFIPEFLLEAPEFGKVYPDRVIPVALGSREAKGPIWLREDPNRDNFYNSVGICSAGRGPDGTIEKNETLWGVAMWEDVDPRIDRFSIYVRGLTNAYRWRDEENAKKEGESMLTGRRLWQKTLKLNFWRPGDRYLEHEGEVRYGIPGQVDYEWVYR